MGKKLPPEDQLAPSHELGGEPTDEDVDMPELDDYDTDPADEGDEPVEIEPVAIPEEEDDGVEAELDTDGEGSREW